jgi:hypothetical protein
MKRKVIGWGRERDKSSRESVEREKRRNRKSRRTWRIVKAKFMEKDCTDIYPHIVGIVSSCTRIEDS